MAGVVGEDGCVAGGEVEGAGCGLRYGGERISVWILLKVAGWYFGRMTYVADEDGSARGAGEEVEPFLSLEVKQSAVSSRPLPYEFHFSLSTHIRMPMQLPQSARLERDNGRSDSLRHGEIARIDRLDRASTAGDFFGGDLAGFVDVGAVPFEFSVRGVDGQV